LNTRSIAITILMMVYIYMDCDLMALCNYHAKPWTNVLLLEHSTTNEHIRETP